MRSSSPRKRRDIAGIPHGLRGSGKPAPYELYPNRERDRVELANNAFLDALLRYGRNHDQALVEAIRLSQAEVGR